MHLNKYMINLRFNTTECAVINSSLCDSSLTGCDQCAAPLLSLFVDGISSCETNCPPRFYSNGVTCTGNPETPVTRAMLI